MAVSLKRTPPAVCDNCGRSCITLDQAGIPCYHCNVGTFIHRSEWTFAECPACAQRPNPYCEHCHGRGVIATPLE